MKKIVVPTAAPKPTQIDSSDRRVFLGRMTAVAASATALSACGGGGGGSGDNPPAPTPAPTTPAPTPAPGTPAPTPAPGTPAPTPAPGTPAPTPAPGTPAPTPAPSTPAPTPAPATPAPTPAPATPAPTPPPAGSTITTFTLKSPTTNGAAAFAVGQPFKRGHVPAGAQIAVSGANAQVVVKNTWPDGSAKLALIAGTASLTANSPVTVSVFTGTASTGPALTTTELKAALTQPVSIGCGSFGTCTWQGTDWDSPFQTWITGHRMSSWIYRKQVGTDAHLVAWLEVRLYPGQVVEILPWVENGYLRVAGPTNKDATYTFTMGGTQRFSAAINLLNRTRTVLLSGTALSHWLGTDPNVTVKHAMEYFMSTDLVPSYFATVPTDAQVVGYQVTSFQPLQQGNWPTGMGAPGSSPSIGLLPEWDVLYLTCTSDVPYKSLQFNAYSAGRYGIYYRDETTNRVTNPQSYPTLCLPWNNTSGITACGSSSTNSYCPDATGPQPPYYQNTHTPSMGYLAYLVTGRYYHLETVQFHAVINWLKQTDTNRGTGGILKTNAGACTVRGAAWSLRTLFHAASITPTTDPLYPVFVASVQANIDYAHARYVANPNQNPYGFVTPYGDYTQNNDNILFEAPWMQDFHTGVIGYAVLLGMPISAAHQTKLAAFFQWRGKNVVGRLQGTGSSEWLYRDATPYVIAFGPSDRLDFDTGAGPWYPSWGAMYDATFAEAQAGGSPGPKVAGDLRTGHPEDPESYWGDFQPAMSYAVRLGVPGAAAGYARVTAEPMWQTRLREYNLHPVWAVRTF